MPTNRQLRNPKKKKDGKDRLSIRLRQLQSEHTRGAYLRRCIDDSLFEFDHLDSRDQERLEEYDKGISARRLSAAFDEQLETHLSAPRYHGAGVALAIKMPDSGCTLIW